MRGDAHLLFLLADEALALGEPALALEHHARALDAGLPFAAVRVAQLYEGGVGATALASLADAPAHGTRAAAAAADDDVNDRALVRARGAAPQDRRRGERARGRSAA